MKDILHRFSKTEIHMNQKMLGCSIITSLPLHHISFACGSIFSLSYITSLSFSTLCDDDNKVPTIQANRENKNSLNDVSLSEQSKSTSTDSSAGDPYDNLPENDEPTTCTICLINRQGPCRPYWRKFERCMKNHSPKDGEEGDETESRSMSQVCDVYMLPWIKCIQEYRNRYTIISNDYFQKEVIDEVENSIMDDEKVLLKDIDISSILILSSDWIKYKESNSEISSAQKKEIKESDETVDNNADDVLIEGMARINLWNGKDLSIDLAYVKDQEGNLLGYDQFSDFKKKKTGMKGGENISKEFKGSKVGSCTFHVNPDTIKYVQVFALYRTDVGTNENSQMNEGDATSNPESKYHKSQTLYHSSLISIDDIPTHEEIADEGEGGGDGEGEVEKGGQSTSKSEGVIKEKASPPDK